MSIAYIPSPSGTYIFVQIIVSRPVRPLNFTECSFLLHYFPAIDYDRVEFDESAVKDGTA